ncbi:cytidine deaminase-like protein [Trypanosoma rangeli]|uniref:Cytidine deaminase-like protein n=1 Tax=Trypanosoma rangeli TaxID=5698 RepID=A0A422NXF1_TRYRA|nr:cytidine deaminase-like protein [Trypanosoma rangeli]RNF10212.1 cytidine deaminase-like protein [Trypanosoma rangeli]|eukprot:RNF10212.1 cytidine deaminase-like protein [Trypanosoma rangeli]
MWPAGLKLNSLIPLAQLPVELQSLARGAIDAHRKAYCPYSNFAVGAALLHNDLKITTGCNYENCVLKSCCAELCAIVKSNSEGLRKATAVAIYGRSKTSNAKSLPPPDTLTPPCGVCRQSLVEVADLSNNYESFLVVLVSLDRQHAKVLKLCDLIPLKFGPSDIGMNVSQLQEQVEADEEISKKI